MKERNNNTNIMVSMTWGQAGAGGQQRLEEGEQDKQGHRAKWDALQGTETLRLQGGSLPATGQDLQPAG